MIRGFLSAGRVSQPQTRGSQTAAGEPQRPVGESRGLGFSCSRGPGEEPTRDICPKQGEFMLSSTCSHESEPYLCPV